MPMTMGSAGLLGIAIQTGGQTSDPDYTRMTLGYEELVTDDDKFTYHSLTDLSFGPIKNSETLPPETNMRALPTGAYVTGAWGAGGLSLIPRLDNRLGWLLLAALGEVSTISDIRLTDLSIMGGDGSQDLAIHPENEGINCHIFSMVDINQFFVPWLTVRRLLPNLIDNERVGELFQDAHIGTLTINASSVSPLTFDVTMLARIHEDYAFYPDPFGTGEWSDDITFDELEHFGVTSCEGWVKINDEKYDVTNLTITLTNNLLPPAQTIIIGSYSPTDFPVLGRTLEATVTFLVDTYDLYVSSFIGGDVTYWADISEKTGYTAAGGAGSAVDGWNIECGVLISDMEIVLASQTRMGAVGDGTERFKLCVKSNKDHDSVTWKMQPLRLQPNRPVILQATASFNSISETADPFWFILQNLQTNYELPD